MKRALGCSLMVVASFLAVAGLVAAPLIGGSGEHRRVCGENYDRIEAALASFDALNAIPAGKPDRSCTDTDDHHATISRSYYLPEQHGSPKDVGSLYRDLALRNGWKLLPTEGSTEGSAGEPRCMVKEVEGVEVNLEVWSASKSKDTYEVSASTWPC
ncbi:hypothetical protein [Streptosporangium sp. NPDC000396]|uniref:hypothetical protein n=1 Tax=Streptosporangium sp. NPDC000396 TaxID=3366185 RepID=UPI0036CDFA48